MTVKACMGHLRDLPKSKMGVDLEHDFAAALPSHAREGRGSFTTCKKAAKNSDNGVSWQLTRTGRERPFPGI